MELLVQVVGGAIGAYGVAATVIGSMQRALIFTRPGRIKRAMPGAAAGTYAVSKSFVQAEDGARLEVSESWARDGAKGTIIYFGGRRENTEWATDISSYAAGWSVVTANYRGFGMSEGKASEAAIKADALALFDAVRERGGRVVIAGRSLGSCVALHVAAMRRCEGLVLVSPMDSLKGVLTENWWSKPFAWLLRDRFECVELAKRVDQKTLVVLAAGDWQVPMAASARLYRHLSSEVDVQLIGAVTHCTVHRDSQTLRNIANFLNTVPSRLPGEGQLTVRGVLPRAD